jgi:flagellar biogenesis protein FliO
MNIQGNLTTTPEFVVNGKTLSITIPKTKLTKVIEQKRTLNSKLDTEITGKAEGENTSIKVSLPYSLDAYKENVSISLRDGRVEISFPKISSTVKAIETEKVAVITKTDDVKIEDRISKDVLNEDYLKSLEKLDQEVKAEKNAKNQNSEKMILNKDEVKTKQSSTSGFLGKENKSFSMVGYAGKFVAFLGFVLLLFWGLLQLMKKGFIKKGKLGFLNGADLITVLSTTYVAPKKSLMMIKAHDQVFLVSNTDQGMQLVSEIRNTTSLFKTGDKYISGENFDTNLDSADDNDNEQIIKEDIYQSTAVEDAKGLQKFLNKKDTIKDTVKFSDQLKKKAKNLKPLQQ